MTVKTTRTRRDAAHSNDSEPPCAVLLTREMLSERERVSRRRRVEKMDKMRAQVAALECAIATSFVVANNATDSVWNEFLDPDMQRMRRFLRDMAMVQRHTKQLQAERRELERLLLNHRLAAEAIHHIVLESHGDWEMSSRRWRALSLMHYAPMTVAECMVEIQSAVKEIDQFMALYALDARDNDLFGSADIHFVDVCNVRFVTRKHFQTTDMEALADQLYHVQADQELFQEHVIGRHVQVHLEVLQRLTKDMAIVQAIERYPGVDMLFHTVGMLFRMRREAQEMVGFRPIAAPQLRAAMAQEGMSSARSFFWNTWDATRWDDEGRVVECEARFNGYLRSEHPAYAQRWLSEVFIASKRAEAKLLGTAPPPVLPPSAALPDHQ